MLIAGYRSDLHSIPPNKDSVAQNCGSKKIKAELLWR
jgi:hypothetical protein